MKTRISHSYGFERSGSAREIQLFGWSVAEPQHTWCVGTSSALAIPNVVAPFGFFLEIDWQPFVHFPYRPDQAVCIGVNDHRISPYRFNRRETAAFYCPPPRASDQKLVITFHHPDAARISDHFETDDSREVAIRFHKLRILPLQEQPPSRLRNSSEMRGRIRNDHVHGVTAQREIQVPLQDLAKKFEMLAGNCDMGLALREVGVEQLSFLRFAGATPEGLMQGLESGFSGLGEHLTTEVADNPMQEWMIRDAFGLRFHTDQSSRSMTEADVVKRHEKHVQFLCRKFMEDLQSGDKIFVFADHERPRSFETALALFLALNRRAPNRMLWVCPNRGEMPGGRVDEIVPGLARGSLDIFDGPLAAGHIAVSGWMNVLFNALWVLKGSSSG